MLVGPHDAPDVVSIAFDRVRRTHTVIQQIRPYLFRTVTTIALDQHRGRRRRQARDLHALLPQTAGGLKSKMLTARPSLRSDEGVTEAEITVALQDWQCEVSTGFLQHWYGRLQQLTAAFATEHADVVAEIRQWNTDATARAQRVIDANP